MTDNLYNCVFQYRTPGGHKVTARAKAIAADAPAALIIGERIVRNHKSRRIHHLVYREAFLAQK